MSPVAATALNKVYGLKVAMKNQFLLLLAVIITACSSQKQEAPAPELSLADTPAEVPLSSLALPVTISYADIEKRINKEIGQLLYEDRDFENNGIDNVKLVVKRTGNIRMTALNQYFQFTVPLEIWVEGRVKSSLGGIFSPQQAPQLTKNAVFKLEVTLSSKLEPQADWSVKTQSVVNFKWTESPVLDFGLVKLPIGGLIEKTVASQLNKLGSQIDAEAKKYLQFKPLIEKYWQELQQPIRINGSFPAVLYILPEAISLGPIQPGTAAITLQTGIQAKIVMTTDTLLSRPPLRPMPALQKGLLTEPDVNLMLTASLSYAQLSQLAQQNIGGQTFEFEGGKHKIKLEQISISGLGTTMQARIRLKGSAKAGLFGKKKIDGVYYFTGTPYYDSAKQEIRIKDFDFDVKSRDLLLKSAEWLFKSNFKKQVEAQLRYPMGKELSLLKKTAESALNKPFSPELTLSGKIVKLEPTELRLEAGQLVIYVQSTGSLSVNLK